jgi:hypothetical protein
MAVDFPPGLFDLVIDELEEDPCKPLTADRITSSNGAPEKALPY